MNKLISVFIALVLFFGAFTASAMVEKIGRNEIIIYGVISTPDNAKLKKIFNESRHIKDWIIFIETGGGLVIPGLAMYNTLRDQIKEGKSITTVLQSDAESMGGIIFLAGTKRIIYEGAQFMLHKAYQVNKFQQKVIQKPGTDRYNALKISNDFFVNLLKKFIKGTFEEIDKKLDNTFRLDAKKAYELGIATEYRDMTL